LDGEGAAGGVFFHFLEGRGGLLEGRDEYSPGQ
jgi:hypothetical protein